MPELPEVQTTADGLETVLPGLSIRDVWTNYGGAFHAGKQHIKDRAYFTLFHKEIIGRKFVSIARRGKNVLLHLSAKEDSGKRSPEQTILVHMKMTGHLMYGKYAFRAGKAFAKDPWHATEPGPLQDPFNAWIRLVFSLSNGKHLVLSDMRRFAKVCMTETSSLASYPDLADLGPEPLSPSFTTASFKGRLMLRPNMKMKQALLDQELIAGIGNIYSDEILWLGGVHPLRKVSKVTDAEWRAMHAGMKKVLAKGVSLGGDSMSDYRNAFGEKGGFQACHNAYRRTGKICLKKGCKGTIRRLKVGGRSAHFCDTHQK